MDMIERQIKDLELTRIGFDLEGYYINKNGDVFRTVKTKKDGLHLKPVTASKSYSQGLKVNMMDKNGKQTTCQVHLLMYNVFKGGLKETDKIYFLDGDKTNCKLNNLMSGFELVEFYNQNNVNG